MNSKSEWILRNFYCKICQIFHSTNNYARCKLCECLYCSKNIQFCDECKNYYCSACKMKCICEVILELCPIHDHIKVCHVCDQKICGKCKMEDFEFHTECFKKRNDFKKKEDLEIKKLKIEESPTLNHVNHIYTIPEKDKKYNEILSSIENFEKINNIDLSMEKGEIIQEFLNSKGTELWIKEIEFFFEFMNSALKNNMVENIIISTFKKILFQKETNIIDNRSPNYNILIFSDDEEEELKIHIKQKSEKTPKMNTTGEIYDTSKPTDIETIISNIENKITPQLQDID